MTKDVNINITYVPKPSMLMVIPPLLQVGIIGIGVFTGSAAMQWAGFLVLCLLLIGTLSSFHKHNTALTYDQARKTIDEHEAKRRTQDGKQQ